MALVDNVWYVDYGDGSTTGYYGVTQWVTVTTKVCGNIIRQAATPTAGNERTFVCIASTAGTGATGVSEPTWTVTRGAKNTDSTVTWQEATGIAALNGDLTNTPTWTTVKNTAITLGQVIQNVAGTLILICTTAGTAGNGSEPSWAAFTNAGATTADNTATWTTLGASFTGWSAPHARLANSFASTWGQAGNSFYVASEHAETQSTAMTNTSPGTIASPCNVLCVAKTHTPPQSGDVQTTAIGSITTTGTSGLTNAGSAYYSGLIFNAGTGSGASILNIGNTAASKIKYENCALNVVGTAAGSTINNVATCENILNNTTVSFGATAQSFRVGGNVTWRNTPTAIQGATIPTVLLNANTTTGVLFIEGVDLSGVGSGKTLVGNIASSTQNTILKDCKINASATVQATPFLQPGVYTSVTRTDSAATNYIEQFYKYEGSQIDELTIVRTGGATDGTTAISKKITTSANSSFNFPFILPARVIWNSTTGTNRVVSIYGTLNSASLPNNDDIWLSVEYLGSASTPQGSFATSTKANILSSNSALSSDGSTWGGGGSGAGWSPFVMNVTLSAPQPQLAGYIYVYIRAAKPSTTWYIDPKIVLS